MLHFYKADLVDAESIAKLINTAYRGETSRKGWTTEADILDGLRTTTAEITKMIKRSDAFILIGVQNDEIVATICCELQVIAFKHTVHFGMIAVKPSLQNKGHGKDIITAAETMTRREWRVAGFHMTVISLRTELIEFYERLGYQRTGAFEEFPQNPTLWQPKLDGLSLQVLAKLA
ncbi:MAG: GNAT family N-acetyltransferase [Betaproteobacteria bacterium]|jgi:ribosomal protein S18 acetylase RimI-like enzyme|nr:GNAT family N-acetyltransferase [Betaproteobacteria bacterium]MCH9848584.1 GNAT family N-acetyltransferase [Betaproteobacteria bacterium]MDG1096914.1 GNAT family N-acetyltransferase [Methylophilaceae bacterium]MDG1454411.1 GNAT family N-acetyltransferase [Methylophilaceae bacterium]